MKLLLYFVPRFGSEAVFDARVFGAGEGIASRLGVDATGWNALLRLEDDPFGKRTPYRATLEFMDLAAPTSEVARAVEGLDEELDDIVHPDLSVALLGEDRVFMEAAGAPIRMQYLMRRLAGLSREAYLEHYREVHSGFGLRTPGIAGYVQFYVDHRATREVAGAAGFGGFGVASVSQLYLDSVDDFIAAVSSDPIGGEAIADERTFVDRRQSLDFFSRVLSPEERARPSD